jgi:hypothetical protein
MFGLTRREQRWKADQKAAELLVSVIALALQARIAEAKAKEAEQLAEAARRVTK